MKQQSIVQTMQQGQGKELEPVDVSTGLIQSSGHYLIHLIYWFMMQFHVTLIDEASFTCFIQKDDGTFEKAFADKKPYLNMVCTQVKNIHLFCFFLKIFSYNYVPERVGTNSLVFKMFMGFITTPMYIYCILWLESALEDQKLNFKEGSTEDHVMIDGWFCIS